MKVDSIKNGIVIDHITPGKAMQLYNMLGLDALDCSVAVIKNVSSKKMGKKDIIKVDSCIDCNLDVVGFVSPNATINIIEGGKLAEKKYIDMPGRLVNIIKCKNPRCISATEQELPKIFKITDPAANICRCVFCEEKSNYKV